MTTEAGRPNGVGSVPLWLGSPDRPLFAWLDLPDDGWSPGPRSSARRWVWSRRTRRVRCVTWRIGWRSAGGPRFVSTTRATGDSAGAWTDPGLVAEWLERRPRRNRLCQRDRSGAGGCDRAPAGRHAGCRRARPRRWSGRPGAVGPVRHGQGVPPRQRALSAFGRDQTGDQGAAREEAATARIVRSRTGWSRHPASCSQHDSLGTRADCNRSERPESRLPGARAGPNGKEARARAGGASSSAPRRVRRDQWPGRSPRGSCHHTGADAGADRLLAHTIGRVRRSRSTCRNHRLWPCTRRRVGAVCANDPSSSGQHTSSGC